MGLSIHKTIHWMLALAICLILAPTAADAGSVTFGSSVDANTSDDLVPRNSTLSYDYRIANNSPSTVGVTLVVRGVTRADGSICQKDEGDKCNLSWFLGTTEIPIDHPFPIKLAEYAARTLTFKGSAQSLGTYASEAVIILPKDKKGEEQAPLTVHVSVTRKFLDLGTNPISARGGGRFLSWSQGKIAATVRNNSTKGVDVGAAPTAKLFRDEGDGKFATVIDQPIAPCAGSADHFPYPLDPGTHLDCTFAVNTSKPGKYRLELDLPQANLSEPRPVAEFSVRWPGEIALTLLVAGSLIGAWISNWQASGRRRMVQAAAALDLRLRYRGFLETLDAASNPDSRNLSNLAIEGLNEFVATLETTNDADLDNEIAASEAHLGLLSRFARLEALFRGHGGDINTDAYRDARDAIRDGEADTNARLTILERAIPQPEGPAFAPKRLQINAARYWNRMVSGVRLRQRVVFIDNLLLIISIFLATGVGYYALYVGNAEWGGGGDAVVAFMTGLGATASGALTFTSLATHFAMPTIGAAR